MSDMPLLYVADADEVFRAATETTLTDDFKVRTFADSMTCISLLSERPPAILLLSTNLPDASCIELCHEIRAEPRLNDTYVIVLLPAEATQQHIDEALAAGSDETLTHPIDLAGLNRQLRITHRLATERSSLRQQASYAQQVAMTAMASMGELGTVLQFLSRCFNCKNIQDVARETLSALTQYGLGGAIQVRASRHTLIEATPDAAAEECSAIISKLHGIGRIFEFKRRMVINYEHVSILMNDVPDDTDQRGRIRDNVAMLAEGAEARIASLLIEQDNLRKQDGIRFALGEILAMTSELRDQQRAAQERGQNAVSDVINSFESAFIRFGLTPAQEAELIDLLVDLRQEVTAIGLTATEIDHKLQGVVRSLQSIAEQQLA